jgi:hypothetical protein
LPAYIPVPHSGAGDPQSADRGDITLCNANICSVSSNSSIHLIDEEQPVKKKNRRRRTTGKKTQNEEGRRVFILSSSKKTQPRRKGIFNPAVLRHFQTGRDI